MRFKVGDYVSHGTKRLEMIEGEIIETINNKDYRIRRDTGVCSTLPKFLIDAGWYRNEDKTVSLILKKYGLENS